MHATARKIVHRQRLLNMIGRPISGHVTLIVAPAGYGKSVLATQWARQADLPAFTVSVEAVRHGEQSLSAYIQQRITDGTAHPDTDQTQTTMQRRCGRESFNQSSHFADGEMTAVALVLDDVDDLPVTELSTLLDTLLDSLSATILVICRRYPDAPVFGALAKAGQLREISASHLRFTYDELAALIDLHGLPDVGPSVRASILEASSGWVSGLTLDLVPALAEPGSQSHFLFDTYVRYVVLSGLPESAIAPLLATLALPSIEASLWSAMFPSSHDSVSFSVFLEAYPYLILQDDQSYRHIPMLEQSLRRLAPDLDPTERWREDARRVIGFLEASEKYAEAISVALRIGSEQDIVRVALNACEHLAMCDLHEEVIHILEPIPTKTLLLDDRLVYWSILAMLSCGQIKQGRLLYEQIQHTWDTSDDDLRRGRLLVCQTLLSIFDGRREQALSLAQEALAILPSTAVHERFRAASSSSVLSAHLGDLERSKTMFNEARVYRSSLPRNQSWWHVFVLPDQADRLAVAGDLQSAVSLYTYQLSTFPEDLQSRSSLIHLRLALIFLEQNRLSKAKRHLDQIAVLNQEAYWDLEVTLARVQLLEATGRPREAMRLAEQVVHDATARWSDVLLSRAETLLASLWIDHGSLALAQAWSEKASLSVDSWPRTFGQPLAHTVLAHIKIAEGSYVEALSVLDVVIAEGQRRRQVGPVVRAYALASVAHLNLGHAEEGAEYLSKAEQLGAPGPFVRSFLVSGVDIRKVADRKIPLTGGPSPIAISKREMEILRLLDSGLDTQGIATQLSISVFTVKTHLSKLYAKLDAKNRAHALSVARAQGLIR